MPLHKVPRRTLPAGEGEPGQDRGVHRIHPLDLPAEQHAPDEGSRPEGPDRVHRVPRIHGLPADPGDFTHRAGQLREHPGQLGHAGQGHRTGSARFQMILPIVVSDRALP